MSAISTVRGLVSRYGRRTSCQRMAVKRRLIIRVKIFNDTDRDNKRVANEKTNPEGEIGTKRRREEGEEMEKGCSEVP